MGNGVIYDMRFIALLLVLLFLGGSIIGGALYFGVMTVDNDWNIAFGISEPEKKPEKAEVDADPPKAPSSGRDLAMEDESKKQAKELEDIDYSDPAERQKAIMLVEKDLQKKHKTAVTFLDEHDPDYLKRKSREEALGKWIEKQQ